MSPTTHRHRLLAVTAVAALALGAGACSTDGGDDAATQTSTVATSTSKGSGAGSSSSGRTTTTTQVDDPADAEPIASTTGQAPTTPNDSSPVDLRLDVRSVERLEGDTVQVSFDLTNTSDEDAGDENDYAPYSTLSDPTYRGYDVGGMTLLDRPHDKRYLTLYDTAKHCLCTDGLSSLEIAPGETISMYADITGPPDSVREVDLSVPGFLPVTGLTIR